MRISTKGTYGLRAMIDLAMHSDAGPVSLKSIAERQDVSELYLEQIFALLRKSSLVESKRGVKGGYYLNREPREISVHEILECLEGKLSIVQCLEDGSEACPRDQICPTRVLWKRINGAISRTLDSYTLEDLIVEARYREQNSPDQEGGDILS